MKNMFDDFEVISIYTRKQAIEDGVFVDVSGYAKKNGFLIPVALTTNLFNTHIRKDTDSETNRRLDIFLFIAHEGIVNHPNRDTESRLELFFKFDGVEMTKVWVTIEAQAPNDPTPAITFMLPEDY